MTPYKGKRQNLTAAQRKYNKHLSFKEIGRDYSVDIKKTFQLGPELASAFAIPFLATVLSSIREVSVALSQD